MAQLSAIKATAVICDICGQEEKGKGYLERHFEKKHKRFTCTTCQQVYRQKTNLLEHLRLHFERFVCQYCGLEVRRFDQFQRHVYEKHEPNNKALILSIQPRESYACRFCVRTFPRVIHRNCHEHSVHKGRSEEAFKCKQCNLIFTTKEQLRAHSFEHYAGRLHFCAFPGCDRFFKLAKHLRNHNLIHGPPSFKCVLCDRKFYQSSNFCKHKKRCKGRPMSMSAQTREEQEEVIQAARQQFLLLGGRLKEPDQTQRILINQRRKTLKSLSIKRNKIKSCETAKSEGVKVRVKVNEVKVEVKEESLELFKAELREADANKANRSEFLCDFCGINTSTLRKLGEHMRQHAKRPEQCNLCHRTPRSLTKHMKEVHADKKSFVCSICGIGFKARTTLNNHVKTHDVPTECPICHKFLPNIQRHLQWHKKQKPAPQNCPVCKRSLATKQTLDEHIHRVHEKVPLGKLYSCEICKLNFIRNHDLLQHAFIHYTGRIHTCSFPDCNKMFKTPFKLHSHMAVHQSVREATFMCSVCNKKYYRQTAVYKHHRQAHPEISAPERFH